MKEEIIIKRLREIGLTAHESKCYLALLGKDTLTVTEVSKLAGIPRRNAYENLEKLLLRGICIERPNSVKTYSALSPAVLKDQILDDLLRENEVKMQNLIDEKEASKTTITNLLIELTPIFEKGRNNSNPLDYIEFYKTSGQIRQKFIQMCSEAEKEIVNFVKPPFSYVTKEQKRAQAAVQDEAMNRGVKLRTIHEIPEIEKDRIAYYKWMAENYTKGKEEMRAIAQLPMKLLVVDAKKVLFTLEAPIKGDTIINKSVADTGLVIQHSALSESLTELFELYWGRATDIEDMGIL